MTFLSPTDNAYINTLWALTNSECIETLKRNFNFTMPTLWVQSIKSTSNERKSKYFPNRVLKVFETFIWRTPCNIHIVTKKERFARFALKMPLVETIAINFHRMVGWLYSAIGQNDFIYANQAVSPRVAVFALALPCESRSSLLVKSRLFGVLDAPWH